MSSELDQKAKDAFIDENFELALDLYTQAISQNPNQAELYADRAQANIKLSNFPEAVNDANRSIELDSSIAKAYYRKGVACLKLEEYQTAKAALEVGASLTKGESKYLNLIKECDQSIAVEEMSDTLKEPRAEARSINEIPAENVDLSPHSLPVPSASKPKYRHDYYQKSNEVLVTIFAKKIPENCVSVQFGEQIMSVSIATPGEEPYHFQARLFAKILPDKCKHEVLSTKIEIRLIKAEEVFWTSLEYNKNVVVHRKVESGEVVEGRPSYPSSKPNKKDWDKIEALVKKEEKEEKLEGNAALNKFFKDIYADSDEDTRRAMSKSFVESNGTVLSTNWSEVGSKKVDGSPPDGMEMKKWEY